MASKPGLGQEKHGGPGPTLHHLWPPLCPLANSTNSLLWLNSHSLSLEDLLSPRPSALCGARVLGGRRKQHLTHPTRPESCSAQSV